MSYEEASSVLTDDIKAAIIHRGQKHVDQMFRNVSGPEALRIRSGELTAEERAEPDGFALIRHAAAVFAELTL